MKESNLTEKEIELRSREFNNSLSSKLYRIEQILNYHQENPERLEFNKERVSDICNFYYQLRSIFENKYGFDFGYEMGYGPFEKIEDSLYFPNGQVKVKKDTLEKYSRLSNLVCETREKLGEKN